jgi:hypothetical protein
MGACPNAILETANITVALIKETRRIALSSNIPTSLTAPRSRHKPFVTVYFHYFASAAQ